MWRQSVEGNTVEDDGTGVRHEARKRVEQGRLPGTVRTDQPDEGTGGDIEVHIDDGCHAAI
jgi:hypothetical protein